MKIKFQILCAFLCTIVFLSSCKKKDDNTSGPPTPIPTPATPTSTALPIVATSVVRNINDSTAITGGTITSKGDSLFQAGVCWSEQPNPTTLDDKTIESFAASSYASELKGLKPYTTYYVRAYAKNKWGTAYGVEFSFRTLKTYNWVNWSTGLNFVFPRYISLIVPYNSDIITGGTTKNLYKSTAGTNNWAPLTQILGENDESAGIIYSANLVNKNGELFAAVNHLGILHSLDGGMSWNTKGKGTVDSNVTIIQVMDNDLYVFNRDKSTIYKSTDNGSSWTGLHISQNPVNITSLITAGGALFVIEPTTKRIYVSSDKGANWTYRTHSLYYNGVASAGDDLFAWSENYEVYVSRDKAVSWQKLNDLYNIEATSVTREGNTIYIGARGKVYMSPDNGEHWIRFGYGLPSNYQVIGLKVISGSLYAIVLSSSVGSGIYKVDL